MAEFSYPFDGGTGAFVTEDDWSLMARNWQEDGVIARAYGTVDLEVETLGDPNTVILYPGAAHIQGFMYRNTDEMPLNFSTNESAHPRIDRVVLRLDRDTNEIRAVVKEGIPAASPAAPDLDTTYPIYEISLGTYQVAAGDNRTIFVDTARPLISRRILVSEALSGHPEGCIVWNPVEDKFYQIGARGVAKEIGAGGGGGGGGVISLVKSVDQTFSGSGIRTQDTELAYLPPDGFEDTCIVEGCIFYWCNTPGATAIFQLAGTALTPPSTKAHFFWHPASTGQLQGQAQADNSLGNMGITFGAQASNTFYSVQFSFVGRFISFDDEDFDTIALRYTPDNSAQWTISAHSWMRITPLGVAVE